MTAKKKFDGHLLSMRIDDEMNQLIEDKSSELNLNKSKLLKHAFNEWIILKRIIRDRNMILIEKHFFGFLLNETSIDKIVESAQKNGERFLNAFKIRILRENEKFTIETLLKDIQCVFGGEINNWFDSFDYRFSPNKTEIQIYGLHPLDKKFSHYTKELFSYLITNSFSQYRLIEDKDTIMENAIHLVFSLK